MWGALRLPAGSELLFLRELYAVLPLFFLALIPVPVPVNGVMSAEFFCHTHGIEERETPTMIFPVR